MRTKNSILVGKTRQAAAMVALGALLAAPMMAGDCISARSAVVFTELDPSESPPGHQSESDHCFAGKLRGPLKGTLVLCISEDETVRGDNLCTCDSTDPIWDREGEGDVLVYRSKSWFSTSSGGFEAVEKGVQLENSGYPIYPYPEPRQYWTGVMQILPDSGTGDYEDFVYGTLIIHNNWNNPDKAELLGEICSP